MTEKTRITIIAGAVIAALSLGFFVAGPYLFSKWQKDVSAMRSSQK